MYTFIELYFVSNTNGCIHWMNLPRDFLRCVIRFALAPIGYIFAAGKVNITRIFVHVFHEMVRFDLRHEDGTSKEGEIGIDDRMQHLFIQISSVFMPVLYRSTRRKQSRTRAQAEQPRRLWVYNLHGSRVHNLVDLTTDH